GRLAPPARAVLYHGFMWNFRHGVARIRGSGGNPMSRRHDNHEESAVVEKVWLKSYPPGAPAEIDVSAFASLRHMLDASFERYRDLPAFSNMGKVLSYADIDQQSRYFAAFLQKSAGLKKGDR